MQRRVAWVPLGIVAVYVAAVLALCHPDRAQVATMLALYARSLTSVWLMVGLLALLWTTMRLHLAGTPRSPRLIAGEFLRTRWEHDRLMSAWLPLACIVPLITAYSVFKECYLPTVGFWFGKLISAGDRMIFGVDAWRLTHRAITSPWATRGIDLAYHGWFVPMVVGVALCSFAPIGSRLAWRYLTTYVSLWTLQGSLAAALMPAAGPALYASMHPGTTRFAGFVELLHQQDLFLRAHGAAGLYAVEYQQGLLALFGSSEVAIGGGISAMPSLHNAMAVLFACACWSLGRRAGIAATLYALLIWIGSIHLGWHYALDGMVACALTVLTWRVIGDVPALLARLSLPRAPHPVTAPALG